MPKTKTTGFYFKASQEEMEWIEKGMKQANINNKSAYLRKMAIDGHIINLDLTGLNEIGKLFRITANNMNQVAKHLNSGGEINKACKNSFEEANNQLTRIRKDFGKYLLILSDITNPKPGKRFMRPVTIRDLPEYYGVATDESNSLNENEQEGA